MMKAAALGCVLSLALASAAAAQDTEYKDEGYKEDGFTFRGSLGAGFAPEYEGAAAYEPVPYLDMQAGYGNYFFRFEGSEAQINIIDSKNFHMGPAIGIRRDRGSSSSEAVDRMRNIPYSGAVGGFIEYHNTYEDPRYGERLVLSIVHGAINGKTGTSGVLRGVIYRPLKFVNEGLILSLSGDANWGSDRYMQTYFGVDAADAAASGLPRYDAGSGIRSAGVGVSLDQFLSRHFSVGLRFHYARMMGDAADSPVTRLEGNPNQFFGGLTIGYVM